MWLSGGHRIDFKYSNIILYAYFETNSPYPSDCSVAEAGKLFSIKGQIVAVSWLFEALWDRDLSQLLNSAGIHRVKAATDERAWLLSMKPLFTKPGRGLNWAFWQQFLNLYSIVCLLFIWEFCSMSLVWLLKYGSLWYILFKYSFSII